MLLRVVAVVVACSLFVAFAVISVWAARTGVPGIYLAALIAAAGVVAFIAIDQALLVARDARRGA